MQYYLFDLDGTLTDPWEGITRGVAHALKYYGIEVKDRTILNSFIGPPLTQSFEEFYGFSHEQALEALGKYREYYGGDGKFENRVYDGIPHMLQRLKDQGKTLIVATSKPTVFSVEILERFDLAGYFDDVQGSELGGARVEKHEVIAYALERNRITDLSQSVMIGDRKFDMIGAAKNGLRAIGVEYGYGSREELLGSGAMQTVKTVSELEEMLCGLP